MRNPISTVNDYFRKIIKTHMFRQAAQMAGWQVLTKGIGFFAAVWSARCLGPENLGKSGLIFAASAQAIFLTTLSIESLLVREFRTATEERKKELVATYTTLKFFLGAIYSLIAIVVAFTVFRGTEYQIGILLGVPFFLLNANNASWILMAKEDMPANSRASAVMSLVVAVLTFCFFRPGQSAYSDLMVLTVGAAFAFVIVWKTAWNQSIFSVIQPKLLPYAWRMISQGKWLFCIGVLSYIYTSVEQPLVGYLYSVEELGKYRTAVNLAATLQQFIVLLPALYYSRLIDWQKSGYDYFWRQQVKLAFLLLTSGLLISTVFLITSHFIYLKLFGPEFQSAALPFGLLACSKGLLMVEGVFSWGLLAVRQDKLVSTLLCVVALCCLPLYLFLIPKYGMLAAASVNLSGQAMYTILCFYFSYNLVRNHHS